MKKILVSLVILFVGLTVLMTQVSQMQVFAASGCTPMKNTTLVIRGKITSGTLQPLTGVPVRATNTKTNRCAKTMTDAEGRYALSVSSGILRISPLAFQNLRFVPAFYKLKIATDTSNLNFVGVNQ